MGGVTWRCFAQVVSSGGCQLDGWTVEQGEKVETGGVGQGGVQFEGAVGTFRMLCAPVGRSVGLPICRVR